MPVLNKTSTSVHYVRFTYKYCITTKATLKVTAYTIEKHISSGTIQQVWLMAYKEDITRESR